MVSGQSRREQCADAYGRGIPTRRACGLIGMARSTLSYELRQPARDAPVLAAMRRLSSQYPRYAYRRIRIFLRREGRGHCRHVPRTMSGPTTSCSTLVPTGSRLRA